MNLRETLFNPTRGKDFGCPVRRLLQSSRGKTSLVAARIFSTFIFHPELCRGRPTGSMPQFFWSSEACYTGAQVAGASQCWTLPAVVLFGDRGWNSILSGIPAPPCSPWEQLGGVCRRHCPPRPCSGHSLFCPRVHLSLLLTAPESPKEGLRKTQSALPQWAASCNAQLPQMVFRDFHALPQAMSPLS